MSASLRDRVRNVLAATFGVAPASVTETTSSANVEAWDSMNHLHLMVALEGEFGVSFDPEQAIELSSVKAIEDALRALGVT